MKPFSISGQKCSGSQVINFVVDEWEFRVLSAVNVLRKWSSSAFSNVSGVSEILGINEEELIVHVFELLLSQESVFKHRWLLIPVNEGIILLVNPMVGYC